jgi:hypothetical protein
LGGAAVGQWFLGTDPRFPVGPGYTIIRYGRRASERRAPRGEAAMRIRAAVARAGNPQPKFEDVELSGPRADEMLADLFIPMLVDLFMAGRLPFDRFVRFYDHEKIAEAFADIESGKTIKPILRFT